MQRFAGVLFCLTAAGPACADCQVADSSYLHGELDRAEAAFATLDVVGFNAATDRVRVAIPCLTEAIPPSLVARIHRFEGIRQFSDGDALQASVAFAASRAIDPTDGFSEDLVPDGNPIRKLYEALDVGAAETTLAAAPAEGELYFDGRASTRRPADWPSVYQRLDTAGQPIESAYLWPDDPVPAYPLAPVPTEPDLVDPGVDLSVDRPRRSPGRVFIVSGAVGTTVAAVAWGMSWQQRAIFLDESTPAADLDRSFRRNHAFGVAAAAGGAVAVLSSVGVVLTGAF